MLAEISEASRLDRCSLPSACSPPSPPPTPGAALLVLPLVGLLRGFARERDARIPQTLELGRAYRGTALLLGDLLEEDDEYTGHHTQDVVELSVRVADQLGVSEERPPRRPSSARCCTTSARSPSRTRSSTSPARSTTRSGR